MTSNLVSIGEDIYLVHGANAVQGNDPHLIIILGWMSARLPHLVKYSLAYQKLYPDTTQVIVRSNLSFVWSTENAKRRRLKPAVDFIVSLCNTTPHARILTHAFSNGGSYNLINLGEAFSLYTAKVPPRLCGAIVFDSTPGGGTLSATIRAFTASIRNPIIRLLAILLVVPTYAVRNVLAFLLRRPGVRRTLQLGVLNSQIVPWVNTRTPRLYVYSKADVMIPWRDVQAHIKEADAAGMCIHSEMLETSEHVAHARREPERYWNAVQQVWNEAVVQEEMKS